MESFKITYIGGIGRVTGSCTLVQHNQNKFLIDCGMIQGEAHADHENEQPFPFNPQDIKYVILTHAHLDHCGLLPRLVAEGFNGKIYCSNATKLLAIEILEDSARISKLYHRNDIEKLKFESLDQRDGFKWGKLVPIDNNLMLALYHSAHILGAVSACIADKVSTDSIWFSGDVGRNCREEMLQPLLKYRQSPDYRNKLVVCESTYGAKPSSEKLRGFNERQENFKHILEETLIQKRGNVVIPAFSMQRTQDVLTDLYLLLQKNPSMCNGISVVCDSQLARKISKIYASELFSCQMKDGEKNYKYLNPALLDQMSSDPENGVRQLRDIFSSNRTSIGQHYFYWKKSCAAFEKPAVYITSSGMCSAGPVLKHLSRRLRDERNTIILTGYQGQGTVGSKLISIRDGLQLEDKPLHSEIEIRPGEVKARIMKVDDYSGHADSNGLLDYLFNKEKGYTSPEIHLNHGDDQARRQLKDSIKKHSDELEVKFPGKFIQPTVCIPERNSTYTLTNGKVERVEQEAQGADVLSEVLNQLRSIDKRLAIIEASITNQVIPEAGLTPQKKRNKTENSRQPDFKVNRDVQKSIKNPGNTVFRTTIDYSANFSTDSDLLNEICQRHPAITQARMSEQDAIGMNVVYGSYVIYIRDEFTHSGSGQYSGNQSGWTEKETVGEMIHLISTIDVARTPVTQFTFGCGRGKSYSKPRYTDQYLNIQRNPDGSISMI